MRYWHYSFCDSMFSNEEKILARAQSLVDRKTLEDLDKKGLQVIFKEYQRLTQDYGLLLADMKFITKIGDRLQHKLNSLNERLTEKTVQLEHAKDLIQVQNNKLQSAKEELEEKVKERTRELEKAYSDLLVSNQELDDFVYNASHDLKGPIVRLIGLCNVGLQEIEDEKSMKYLSMLQEISNQMNDMLGGLLHINNLKHSIVTPDKVLVNGVLEEVLGNLTKFKKFDLSQINIEAPELLIIRSDLEILRTLFQNIFEYCVANSIPQESGKAIHFNLKIEKQFLIIEVTLFCSKIPDKVKQEIFNLFYRTSNNPHHTGMELYTVSLAAEKLGGKVALSCSEKNTSKFIITLPEILV
ncbi:ATP-binding protein [Flexithrix dorotheae]|uniref:ATP-binding protein n=1 Tax=Flexithrix dorotheae TaxID=70993 RepID=UPI0012FAD619|nr:HAMP domain-containing sensor histidine kinase [Flexithrix dorotheae]